MKLTQYTRQEAAIAASESSGIRQRWLYGLRLVNDAEKMSSGGGGLKHGAAEQLIAAATARGLKLSAREIRYRIQCARAYPTEAQIGSAAADFESWRALCDAGFPPIERDAAEPDADWRTDSERTSDRARALTDHLDAQEAMFPLSRFEPVETTLKDLQEFVEEQERITESFAATSRKRRAELDRLTAAAGGDLSVTWAEAHRLAEAAEESG